MADPQRMPPIAGNPASVTAVSGSSTSSGATTVATAPAPNTAAPTSGGNHWLSGTAGYFTASLLWGLNLPLSAELLKTFDPFWVSPLRYMISALVLGLLVVVLHGVRQLGAPIPLGRVALLSLFVAGFLQLYNLGLAHAHPMTVAALSAGSPVYVAIVSRLMTGSRLERGFWGATALTLVGAGIAISGRAKAAGAGGAGLALEGGEPLIILSIASWTAYSILAQRWFRPEVSQLRRTWLSTIGALPWLLAFWALARLIGLAGPPMLSPPLVPALQLLMAALLCTAAATVAWNVGVNRLGIQMGAVWQNLVPVFAVLLALLLFQVQPLPEQILGGAIVLLGVLYMQWMRWRA